MSDIINRLRNKKPTPTPQYVLVELHEAADHIEALEKQNAELLAALMMVSTNKDGQCENGYSPEHVALTALVQLQPSTQEVSK